MHLIFVTCVIGVQRGAEVGRTLIRIIPHAVVVVEVKAKTEVLVDIDAEYRFDMVFALLFVTTVVLGDVGIG